MTQSGHQPLVAGRFRGDNPFTLDKADEHTFLKVWQDAAAFMKRQPGFISTQIHRAIGESPTYLNYAVWQSTADFRAAFTHPDFTAKLSLFLASKARAAEFDTSFYAVQALELAAGAVNITLLGLNLRHGLTMKGWLRRQPA